jgi:membrane protease YdiL (CAAX protease family)
VPADIWNEVARTLTAGAVVAAVAVPVGAAAWVWTRRKPVALSSEPWHAPWGAFEVIAAFLLLNLITPMFVFQALSVGGFYQVVYGNTFPPAAGPLPPVEASAGVAGFAAATPTHDHLQELNTVRMLWASFFALPIQLGLLLTVRTLMYPAWRFVPPRREWAHAIALAVVAWVAITSVVLTVNLLVNWSFVALEWSPREHPLSRLANRPALDRLLFVFQACVAAPVMEEVIFRGVLLPWLLASTSRTVPVLVAAAVVSAGAVVGEEMTTATLTRGPVVFGVALLLAGLVFAGGRWQKAGAVYASAALFAAVHATVWPTPIPLFVFGVGVGYLALRTRSVLVPIVVHGLFNAVAATIVLRGGA